MNTNQRTFWTLLLAVGLATLWSCKAQGAAANWYVRPSGGSGAGTSWTAAWSIAQLNANWASVAAGDTVWFAGGSYTTGITPLKSGSAGSPIYLKRVVSTDAVPTAAAGWSAAFDSQVDITTSGAAMSWAGQKITGSYLYVDGRMDSGIRLKTTSLGGSYIGAVYLGYESGGQRDLTFTNIDMCGPAPSSAAFSYNDYVCAFSTWNWGAAGFGGSSNIVISASRLHGAADVIMTTFTRYITIENCKIYDNNISSAVHANVWEANNTTEVTFRNNEVYGWQVEGLRPYGGAANWYIYGNVFRDTINCGSCYTRVFEADSSVATSWGPWYVYNNTFVNIYWGGVNGAGPVFSATTGKAFHPSSVSSNNIFWYTGLGGNVPANSGYNYYRGTTSEGGSINGTAATPFVDYAGKNYHIVTNIAAAYPRDKGKVITNAYTIDMDGNVRGTDGLWDMGAYEGEGGVSVDTNPPAITSQPNSVSKSEGDTLNLAVTATGTAPLAYQWRFNGTAIGAATASSYAQYYLAPADAGSYSVIVTNTYGTITSSNAVVTVATTNVPPPGTIQNMTVQYATVTGTMTIYAGPQAACSVAPLYVNFGQVITNVPAWSSIVVSNGGEFGSTLAGTATTADPFTITNGVYSITNGQTATVWIKYLPTTLGTNYEFAYATAGGCGATLYGIGVEAAVPLLSVSSVSNYFGSIRTNTVAWTSVTLTNSGSVGAGTLSVTGSVSAPFAITNLITELAQGEWTNLWISYTPTSASTNSDTLGLAGGGGASVAVYGIATNAPEVGGETNTFFVSEDFEGSEDGYTNFNASYVSWNNSDSPIEGTYSLRLQSGGTTSAGAWKTNVLNTLNTIYGYVRIRVSTPRADKANIVPIFFGRDSTQTNYVIRVSIGAANGLNVYHGTGNDGAVSTGLVLNDTNAVYHVWVSYKSAPSGQCTLGISTNGVRPTTGTNYLAGSGTYTTTNTIYHCGPYNSYNGNWNYIYFDHMRWSTNLIGNNGD